MNLLNVFRKRSTLGLLNTSIMTSVGTFKLKDITLDEAIKLLAKNENNLESAIGHVSTAAIMTQLLGTTINQNRIQFEQKKGQKALVFKLLGRAPEGVILTDKEIATIGFKFQLLERIK
jgi:hypothetical protein